MKMSNLLRHAQGTVVLYLFFIDSLPLVCIMYTMYMKSNIQFKVTKEEGAYIASAIEYAIVTQANTLEELFKNIEEAVLLYSQDEESFSSKPSITIQYDFFQHA